MIKREQFKKILKHGWSLFPVCIPSYKRWEVSSNKTMANIINKCSQAAQHKTYLFVRAEQEADYRRNFPHVNIVALPPVDGLSGTRQYIADFVSGTLKQPYYIDMDDDITDLKYVWCDGREDHLSKKAEEDPESVLRLACAFSKMAFEQYKCVLGNLHRTRFASTFPASQTAFHINKGSTPRQVTFVNARALALRGIKRSTIFDPTGDDVGFVAEVAKSGGDFFQIPSLAYSFVDDAVNSVIRNDTNRRQLAEYEHKALLAYPMRDYLRITQTFEDGTYKFSDIDYGRYCKMAGRKKETVSIPAFLNWLTRKGG